MHTTYGIIACRMGRVHRFERELDLKMLTFLGKLRKNGWAVTILPLVTR